MGQLQQGTTETNHLKYDSVKWQEIYVYHAEDNGRILSYGIDQ